MILNLKKMSDIENIIRIQISDPSSKTDPYMRGMANGMIMIESIINGTEPKFIDSPRNLNQDLSNAGPK